MTTDVQQTGWTIGPSLQISCYCNTNKMSPSLLISLTVRQCYKSYSKVEIHCKGGGSETVHLFSFWQTTHKQLDVTSLLHSQCDSFVHFIITSLMTHTHTAEFLTHCLAECGNDQIQVIETQTGLPSPACTLVMILMSSVYVMPNT